MDLFLIKPVREFCHWPLTLTPSSSSSGSSSSINSNNSNSSNSIVLADLVDVYWPYGRCRRPGPPAPQHAGSADFGCLSPRSCTSDIGGRTRSSGLAHRRDTRRCPVMLAASVTIEVRELYQVLLLFNGSCMFVLCVCNLFNVWYVVLPICFLCVVCVVTYVLCYFMCLMYLNVAFMFVLCRVCFLWLFTELVAQRL